MPIFRGSVRGGIYEDSLPTEPDPEQERSFGQPQPENMPKCVICGEDVHGKRRYYCSRKCADAAYRKAVEARRKREGRP